MLGDGQVCRAGVEEVAVRGRGGNVKKGMKTMEKKSEGWRKLRQGRKRGEGKGEQTGRTGRVREDV